MKKWWQTSDSIPPFCVMFWILSYCQFHISTWIIIAVIKTSNYDVILTEICLYLSTYHAERVTETGGMNSENGAKFSIFWPFCELGGWSNSIWKGPILTLFKGLKPSPVIICYSRRAEFWPFWWLHLGWKKCMLRVARRVYCMSPLFRGLEFTSGMSSCAHDKKL